MGYDLNNPLSYFTLGFILGYVWLNHLRKKKENFETKRRLESARSGFHGRTLKELNDALKALVFRYKQENKDFALTIELNNMPIIQVVHRGNFPVVLNSEVDNDFGLVFYVRFEEEQDTQVKEKLVNFIQALEIENYSTPDQRAIYFSLGDGSFLNYPKVVLTRIVVEVFGFKVEEEDQMKLRLVHLEINPNL